MGLRVFAVALTLLILPTPSASAQSFLESLFGFSGAPSRSRSYDRPRTRERESRTYSRESRERDTPRQVRAHYNAPQSYERSGTYRTYCVRMCDGFYFPINYASSNLTRDAERCTASCDGARLFYHRTGGEPEEMVDLAGRAYTSYPIAFKHRTELVQGCQCRPPPWTEAEMARHRTYASKLKPLVRAQLPIQTRLRAAAPAASPPPPPPVVNVTAPMTPVETVSPTPAAADHDFASFTLPPLPTAVSDSTPHGPPRLR